VTNEFRDYIIKLDHNMCRAYGCGSSTLLEVHHIVPRSAGGLDEPWNCITLCQKCHRLVTIKLISNMDLLTTILNDYDFRWKRALEQIKSLHDMHELKKVNRQRNMDNGQH